MNATQGDQILWRHIRDLPYFRAMLRAVEDSYYQEIVIPRPILDLGCGDGQFASVAFNPPPEIGVDPWAEPVREAQSRGVYRMVLQSDGAKMPFPDHWFASVTSTSVLEHIPHIDAVLSETSRVLQTGGMFLFCVPNQRFPEYLRGTQTLRRMGLKGAAAAYGRFFNRIARHAHTDEPAVWEKRLDNAGFVLERCWDYFPPEALHILEAGHLFGLPALFWRRLTGKWILVQQKWNLWIPYQMARPFLDRRESDEGVCTFFVARKN
ncbi:MAG TPA: class I SAM-dependent methyltransferase [Anaerolineaceae bacterium]|nr:class I SAM-dependent methyltransferase [Anaerolineaceae bacterium]